MLKKIFKWTLLSILVLVALVLISSNFLYKKKYEAPYPNIKASTDSATIARGKYLVMGPAHCADCHGAPGTEAAVDRGEEIPLQGGRSFVLPPGTFYPINLTPDPTGIGNLKDEEIARALRHGVGHDGRNMIDIMPFHNTSDEDMVAIISYLRATKPVKNATPKTEYTALGKMIFSFALKPVGPEGEVPRSVTRDSSAEYGKYLAFSVANCRGCHTNRDLKTGAYIGEPFAGGFEMDLGEGTDHIFTTPNITPAKLGRMNGWTEEQFIKRFREGRKIAGSPMPWGPFSRLDETDLKAIYRFMQTVKPVEIEYAEMIRKKS
ncbi:MAG TPA: c-type cytochrome [Chitinophagaceae bacterium]|nr:c-type cytochrome [Chitinophagaceae bacterium]